MKIRTSFCALGLLIAGCFPIEQAPLVYSSKDQFGIGVAAGTPDAPGLDVNIGYKGLDAAFVPVAVAKRCPNRQDVDCENDKYRIQVINGANKIAGRAGLDGALMDAYRVAIEDANKEIDANSRRVAAIRESATRLPAAQQELATYGQPDSVTGQPRTLSATEIAAKAKLEAEITQLAALSSAAAQNEASQLEERNRARATEAAQKQALLDELVARLGETPGDDKTDALSVYGSFNGGANGGQQGATLSLGKAFSTGVAAQHLTQGISAGAKQIAVAQCIAAAQAAVDKAAVVDQPALRNQLMTFCGAK